MCLGIGHFFLYFTQKRRVDPVPALRVKRAPGGGWAGCQFPVEWHRWLLADRRTGQQALRAAGNHEIDYLLVVEAYGKTIILGLG